MKRVYIIGIVGAGKTTLARDLAKRTGLPHHELDAIVHGDDRLHETGGKRIKRTEEERVERIRQINEAGGWIIEGTYRESCHCLLDLADTIIFLDPPLPVRLWRITLRYGKQRLGLEKALYKPSFHMFRMMFRWTRDFERSRKTFETMLARYGEKVQTITGPKELI